MLFSSKPVPTTCVDLFVKRREVPHIPDSDCTVYLADQPAGWNFGHFATIDGDVRPIEYTPSDDAIIEQWIRQNVGTTWHSLGTCKIGSVVDENLNVYGTTGLKIANLSVLPGNVAANTNNMALAVGEKAADIIIGELGL